MKVWKKTNLKYLYQMFKDTKSHGIVSLHFFYFLGVFFDLRPSISNHALTELYQNLSYETLNAERETTNLKVHLTLFLN